MKLLHDLRKNDLGIPEEKVLRIRNLLGSMPDLRKRGRWIRAQPIIIYDPTHNMIYRTQSLRRYGNRRYTRMEPGYMTEAYLGNRYYQGDLAPYVSVQSMSGEYAVTFVD